MDDLALWQEKNRQYREAAVHWIKLRLLHLAQRRASPAKQEEYRPGLWRRFWTWLFGSKDRSTSPQEADRLPSVREKDILKAFEAMEKAAKMDPLPALYLIELRFNLSVFERNLLLLCAAIEMAPGLAELCGAAQNDPGLRHPTFALALDLFEDANWNVLSPERPLRHWRLIDITETSTRPLTTSTLRADEHMVAVILGLNYLDDHIAPLLTSLSAPEEELPSSAQSAVDQIVQRIGQIKGPIPAVQLVGPDSESKDDIAAAACQAMGMALYRMPVETLPTQQTELDTISRLWHRQSVLLPVALCFDLHDTDEASPNNPQLAALRRWLARGGGLFFLKTRDVLTNLDGPTIVQDIDKPTAAEQRTAWLAVLGAGAGRQPELLAAQFRLNLRDISRIGTAVPSSLTDTERDRWLWNECLGEARPRLDTLAQRIDAKATWDDIVLPEEEMRLLRQIGAQVRNRGRVYDDWGFRAQMNRGLGISALFAGDSGSGKTMAAEVIANDLHLNLYRIDLSAVVSKYIGETEKNLRRLFDAAEDGGAILLFDEADALFGKRSEVKDSHDRYANIEINYLLQRMEGFGGLAILASNMKSALDLAFLRRLRFVVNFPFPSAKERKEIWQKSFPKAAQANALDYDRLAAFNLSGGNITNIALNSAFLAARNGGRVGMADVLSAVKSELRKLDRAVHDADYLMPQEAEK